MVAVRGDAPRIASFQEWDGTGGDDEQFLKAFDWNGKELTPRFELDFRELELGRPHIMRFGQIDFYKGRVSQLPTAEGENPG